jgi:hypothetical protein
VLASAGYHVGLHGCLRVRPLRAALAARGLAHHLVHARHVDDAHMHRARRAAVRACGACDPAHASGHASHAMMIMIMQALRAQQAY